MLTKQIRDSLRAYTATMQKTVVLVLQKGEHAARAELRQFLGDFVAVSEHLRIEERDAAQRLRSPLSFFLEVDGRDTGISFSGIPGGHEFNSLVLAVLQASGHPIKLDAAIQNRIRDIATPLRFEVFVSLACHNCPEVVQTLNQFALLNPAIHSEMIDGGLYPDLIAERAIQGVPAVFLNGKVFANGKIDAAKLLDKLMEQFPARRHAENQLNLPCQDVTVIGAGPAGVAAAIYSARKGLKVTLVADRIGGQLKDTLAIENYIGLPKTTGSDLASALRVHLQAYDITLKEHIRVEQLTNGSIKTLKLSSGEIIESKTLIIATGAKWRELNVPGEKDYIGRGVAYCPHCDGPFFKGKDVAVIGGGNSGIEAALDLAGLVKSVTVFEFLPELKADRILVKQAEARSNIRIIKNVAIREIVANNDRVSGLIYTNRANAEVQHQNLDGVFVQIGLVPNSHFVKDLVNISSNGEIEINARCQSSAAGIFACGDVTNVPYKQIIIAAGEGAKAALAAFDHVLMGH